jgi:hypothetical protein
VQRSNYLFTSESVSEGHPDKVCDQISDAILDAFLENDLKLGIADESKVNTRLGCETLCTTNKIVIAGEGRGQAPLFHKRPGRSSRILATTRTDFPITAPTSRFFCTASRRISPWASTPKPRKAARRKARAIKA